MPKLKSHVAGLPVVYILKTSLFDIKLLFQFSRLPVVPSDLDAMVFSVGIIAPTKGLEILRRVQGYSLRDRHFFRHFNLHWVTALKQ